MRFNSLAEAQSAAAAHRDNDVIAVKVIDGESAYWAIRHDPETDQVYL